MNEPSAPTNLRFKNYPLLQALIERRSRRFASGMKLEGGPLSFESKRPPQPLTEEEEAALAFAACGVTGYALAELPYAPGSQPGTFRDGGAAAAWRDAKTVLAFPATRMRQLGPRLPIANTSTNVTGVSQ